MLFITLLTLFIAFIASYPTRRSSIQKPLRVIYPARSNALKANDDDITYKIGSPVLYKPVNVYHVTSMLRLIKVRFTTEIGPKVKKKL
jgi:hypothetical protein